MQIKKWKYDHMLSIEIWSKLHVVYFTSVIQEYTTHMDSRMETGFKELYTK